MKIVYAHHLDRDDHPAAVMVESIARELRRLGHDVVVHASRAHGRPPLPDGTVRPARKYGWLAKCLASDARQTRRDRAALGAHRPDIVLARQDAYRTSITRACLAEGLPLVTYADAPVAHEARRFASSRWHPPGLVEAIERYNLARSRRVVTVSRTAAALLRSYRTKAPIDVVPNGVDPARFPEIRETERRSRRLALGLFRPTVVAFQGTFKPFHGLDLLAKMIAATRLRGDIAWLLVGDGPGLAGLEATFRGRDEIVFLGRRPTEEIGAVLSLADVAVAPLADDDGPFYFCPLKVLECAAAGCAVVTADRGEVPSLLDDGRAGRLVRGRGVDSWIEAILQLADDEDGRRRIGSAGRDFVLSRLTWARTAEAVERCLDESIADDASRLRLGARHQAIPAR